MKSCIWSCQLSGESEATGCLYTKQVAKQKKQNQHLIGLECKFVRFHVLLHLKPQSLQPSSDQYWLSLNHTGLRRFPLFFPPIAEKPGRESAYSSCRSADMCGNLLSGPCQCCINAKTTLPRAATALLRGTGTINYRSMLEGHWSEAAPSTGKPVSRKVRRCHRSYYVYRSVAWDGWLSAAMPSVILDTTASQVPALGEPPLGIGGMWVVMQMAGQEMSRHTIGCPCRDIF